MRYRVLLPCIVALGLMTTAVRAQEQDSDPLRVVIMNASEQIVQQFTVASGATISLTSINNTIRYIQVRHNFEQGWSPATANIGLISLSGLTNADLYVFLGSGSFPTSQTAGPNTPVAINWAGIGLGSGSAFRDYVKVAGGITGNLTGAVQVGEVYRLDIGAVQANIETSHSGPGLFRVFAGSISGNLLASNGSIAMVQATTGDITGSVTATNGSIVDVITSAGSLTGDVTALTGISLVDVHGSISGNLSASGTGAEITTVKVGVNVSGTHTLSGRVQASAGHVGDITVNGAVDINPAGGSSIRSRGGLSSLVCTTISGQTTLGLTVGTDAPGVLGLLKVTGGGFSTGDSTHAGINIAGLPYAQGAESGIILNGDLSGTIYVHHVEGADISAQIKINGNLTGLISYDGTTDLTNQIVVNAANNNGGSWTGHVKLGTFPNGTALNGEPYYTNTSASFGGGAVGLAPFHLHDQDCDPPNGGSHAFQSKTTVILEFYGPITWNPASGCPVQVDWRTAGASTWTALPSTDFSAETVSGHPRQIAVLALTAFDYDDQMDYRIRPVGNVPITCVGVDGGTVPVDSFAYVIHGQ